MAISFSCPACDNRLKVKDDLAGRKVKCPKCGEGVAVPAGEEEEEEAPTAKARPARKAREAPEEERPRKKKKKKQQGNQRLLIGLGAALALLVVVVLIVVLNWPKGRQNVPPTNEPVAQQQPPKQEAAPQAPVVQPQPQQPPPEKRIAGIANRGEDQAVMNDLRQLGIFYKQQVALNGKAPRDAKAFANEIRRDAPHIAKALEEGSYVLLPGPRQGANQLLAYDKAGNTANQHIILRGDGSVDRIGGQDLQKLLPPQGKQ